MDIHDILEKCFMVCFCIVAIIATPLLVWGIGMVIYSGYVEMLKSFGF